MLARLCTAALLALALGLPAAAPAYPPITCGRTSVHGRPYVVRTHGPTCDKAVSWVRGFMLHHRSPHGFGCRAYGAAVPAQCVGTHNKYAYFSATKP